MEFHPLEIEGVLGISSEPQSDARGHFSRIWDADSILNNFRISQASAVHNPIIGTLRGLHFQTNPYSENKVVACITGKVFDVVVDLRLDSLTYGRHLELILGPFEKYFGVIVPSGFAHGYLTLEPNSSLVYFMDKDYSAEHSAGIFWGDPKLSIKWPMQPKVVSSRDSNWPHLV
jgi:dTDP-4-dehydrorhamnose 3,5-epimerase